VAVDLTETLRRLVSIPSVNPMGRDVSGEIYLETRLTDFLARLFASLGLQVHRQTVSPGRDNLWARLDGAVPPEQGGRLVLFDSHQDTVPVDGMMIDPFAAEVRDGRVYGRGACDTKGGMAAVIAAVARLVDERPAGMPTVVVACTVNEEYGFTGAEAAAGLCADPTDSIIPKRPDAAIVTEPTGLDVVVAHKGMIRWKCHACGRAAHSAQPDQGDSAIYRMGHALVAIERYAAGEVKKSAAHPLCGPVTLSVGTICGGVSVNTVPDRCTIEIDRRIPPGEDPDAARQALIEHLKKEALLRDWLEHDPAYLVGLAMSDELNGPLAERLASAAAQVTGDCRRIGVPYGTDAAWFAARGIPTVVFGPGRLEQAHTDDEWIELAEVEQAAEIFYRFCTKDPLPSVHFPLA